MSNYKDYKDNPDVKSVVERIVDTVLTFNKPKAVAFWKDIHPDMLHDIKAFQSMLSDMNLEIQSKYNQLLIDNNLNPEMYHMAINISHEHQDNFSKNIASLFINAVPNKPQAGNED